MGANNCTYSDEEIMRQLRSHDPLFDYQNYVDNENGLTLQDVMSIRQSFLQLRDDYNDPPEMIKVKRLRAFPFLTNDEILQFRNNGNGGCSGVSNVEERFDRSPEKPITFEVHD